MAPVFLLPFLTSGLLCFVKRYTHSTTAHVYRVCGIGLLRECLHLHQQVPFFESTSTPEEHIEEYMTMVPSPRNTTESVVTHHKESLVSHSVAITTYLRVLGVGFLVSVVRLITVARLHRRFPSLHRIPSPRRRASCRRWNE